MAWAQTVIAARVRTIPCISGMGSNVQMTGPGLFAFFTIYVGLCWPWVAVCRETLWRT